MSNNVVTEVVSGESRVPGIGLRRAAWDGCVSHLPRPRVYYSAPYSFHRRPIDVKIAIKCASMTKINIMTR